MSDNQDNTTSGAGRAIIEVLAAEREALERLDQVREEGERSLKSARMRAARIRQRTDHRITQLHKLCLQKNQAELDAFRQQHHQDLLERLARIQPSDEVLEQAANRLAFELVMGDNEDT